MNHKCETCGSPVKICSSGKGDFATNWYEPIESDVVKALRDLCDACLVADQAEELPFNIDGDLLDAAFEALDNSDNRESIESSTTNK
jgi:hypothetical protein